MPPDPAPPAVGSVAHLPAPARPAPARWLPAGACPLAPAGCRCPPPAPAAVPGCRPRLPALPARAGD